VSSLETPSQPTVESVLRALTVSRIHELAREAGLAPRGRQKDRLASDVAGTHRIGFRGLLAQLRREELRAACREHGLSDAGRARQELMQRLLASHGAHDTQPPPPLFSGTAPQRKVPRAGDTIRARHRQWLVDDVHPPVNEGDATWVKLTCLDDGAFTLSAASVYEVRAAQNTAATGATTYLVGSYAMINKCSN
jgi:hypothetical protein